MVKQKTDNTLAKQKTDNTLVKQKTDNALVKQKTDNTLVKQRSTIGQTRIHKTLHVQLMIEQHEPNLT